MCTTFALAPVKVAGVYASYPTPLLASRYSSAPSSVKLATLPRDLTVQESWSGWIGSIKDVNNKELIDSISSQHVTVRHAVRKCEDRLGVRIHTRNVLPFPDRVIPAAGYRVYSTERQGAVYTRWDAKTIPCVCFYICMMRWMLRWDPQCGPNVHKTRG